MSLTDIGRKNFTEKANLGFLDIYEEHWKPLEYKPITLLEIGVYNGNSIKTWTDWFPNALIIGIEKNPQPLVHEMEENRVRFFIGDQADTQFLANMCIEFPEFDIIIDDGGHHWDEQQISFTYLWDHVKSGGMYIIEDLQTSDDPIWAGKDGTYEPTARRLSELTEHVMVDIHRGQIASMHIYPRLCIIKKR